MKYLIKSFAILIFIIGIKTQAQQKDSDRLKSLKIGFITEKLDLTSEEAQSFWPIYNKHQEEIHKLRSEDRKMRREFRKNGGIESISDVEAERILNQFIKLDSKIRQEELGLYKNLKPHLPAKKILILHKTEQDFNRRILEQLKKKRQQKLQRK